MFTREQVQSVHDFIKTKKGCEFTGSRINKSFKSMRRKEVNAILCIIKLFDKRLTLTLRTPKSVKQRPIWHYQ